MTPKTITYALQLAGMHAASIMDPHTADKNWAGSCHESMPLVEISIERSKDWETPENNRVWDRCTVTVAGKIVYTGNRCGARNCYMEFVAAAITR